MIQIATNLLGINTQRNIKTVGTRTDKASERLSSGMRLNRAADDAAGLAISEKMKSQIRGLNKAQRNVEDGMSLVKVADGGMNEIGEMLIRQRELTIQAMNDTNSPEDKEKIQLEIDQLTKEITATAKRTEFNTIPLLSVPITDKDTSEYFLKLGINNVITSSGGLNFTAVNASGDVASLVYQGSASPNGSYNKVLLDDGSGSPVAVDLRSMAQTTTVSGKTATTTFTYNANGYDVSITQVVSIVPSPSRDDGEFYRISTTVRNNNNDDTKISFMFNIDTDFNTGGAGNVNPSYRFDGQETGVTTNSIFEGSDRPFDIDLYNASDPRLAVQLRISGNGDPPDRLFIGQWTQVGNFDFENYVGQSIGDSAYSLVWDRQFSEKNNSFTFTTMFGVIDSRELFEGDISPLHIQIGANANQCMYVDRYDCRARSLGVEPLIVHSVSEANRSLKKIDNAIETLNGYRATAGAQYNRMEHIEGSLGVSSLNLEDANSKIADADMAREAMEYAKGNVLRQAGVSVLAQANQAPQRVLELLR